jgi:hypothetical protein
LFEPLDGFGMVSLGFFKGFFALSHGGAGLLSEFFECVHGDFECGEEPVCNEPVDQHEVV